MAIPWNSIDDKKLRSIERAMRGSGERLDREEDATLRMRLRIIAALSLALAFIVSCNVTVTPESGPLKQIVAFVSELLDPQP